MAMQATLDRRPAIFGGVGRRPLRAPGRAVLRGALRALAVALALLGAGSLLPGGPSAERATAAPAPAAPGLAAILPALGLDAAQEQRVREMLRVEEPWLRRLEQARVESQADLRRAELAQPFDEALVASRLDRHIELSAHRRGTEARLLGRIARLLTPDQQRRLAALRLGDDGARARE